MGVEARNILRQSFKDHKVKYTKPRAKRELSEEQKEVLRARIAVARAAKEAKKFFETLFILVMYVKFWKSF